MRYSPILPRGRSTIRLAIQVKVARLSRTNTPEEARRTILTSLKALIKEEEDNTRQGSRTYSRTYLAVDLTLGRLVTKEENKRSVR
jgi:hypothetical protein